MQVTNIGIPQPWAASFFTYVTETSVEETVDPRKERTDVERRKVDRPASEADLTHAEEGTYEVKATSEEPVVQKSARVVEEVEVHIRNIYKKLDIKNRQDAVQFSQRLWK